MTLKRLRQPWSGGVEEGTRSSEQGQQVNLFGCGVLPFPFLLPPLGLQLLLHVLDVPSQAVAVEVVVTGGFGKGLLLLEGKALCQSSPRALHCLSQPTPRSQESNPPGNHRGR